MGIILLTFGITLSLIDYRLIKDIYRHHYESVNTAALSVVVAIIILFLAGIISLIGIYLSILELQWKLI